MTGSNRRTMFGVAVAAAVLAGAGPASAQQGTQRDLYKTNQSSTLVFQNPCTGDNMLCNVEYNTVCHNELQPDNSYAQKCHAVSHGDCVAVTATYPYEPIPNGAQYTHHDQQTYSNSFTPPCDSRAESVVQERFVSRGKDPDFTLTVKYAANLHQEGNICVFEETQNTRDVQCK